MLSAPTISIAAASAPFLDAVICTADGLVNLADIEREPTSGKHGTSLIEHCQLCISGGGPALPPPSNVGALGAPRMLLSIAWQMRVNVRDDAFELGQQTARAPPNAF
jgi:hypothetical protein